MTAKEKFFQAIDELGATRVENLFGTPSWACLADGNVHIFNQPDGDEHFDHFTISIEYATWSVHVLKMVIWATANDGVSHPHKPDEELLELILKFINEYTDCSEEERVRVMFYLWDIGAFDIPREMGESWLEHESYEDDVDYQSMLRLDDEAHSIISQIQGLFNWLDDHNVGYFLSENGTIEFWNAEQMEMVTGSDRKFEDISLRQAYCANCITGSAIYMPGIEPRDTGFKKNESN